MKGGLSSAIEAMRALRDAKLLPGGGILSPRTITTRVLGEMAGRQRL